MKDNKEWQNDLLDDEALASFKDADDKRLALHRQAVKLLAESRAEAPEGLAAQICKALPEAPDAAIFAGLLSFRPLRQSHSRQWALATAALAILILAVGIFILKLTPAGDRAFVTFELHAPDARMVELVGSFNDWKPGEFFLNGPDASGYWTVSVELEPGRYEYIFLVDGKDWVSDPQAFGARPDGFGHQNSLLEL